MSQTRCRTGIPFPRRTTGIGRKPRQRTSPRDRPVQSESPRRRPRPPRRSLRARRSSATWPADRGSGRDRAAVPAVPAGCVRRSDIARWRPVVQELLRLAVDRARTSQPTTDRRTRGGWPRGFSSRHAAFPSWPPAMNSYTINRLILWPACTQPEPLSGGIVGNLDIAGCGRRTQLVKVVE